MMELQFSAGQLGKQWLAHSCPALWGLHRAPRDLNCRTSWFTMCTYPVDPLALSLQALVARTLHARLPADLHPLVHSDFMVRGCVPRSSERLRWPQHTHVVANAAAYL